MKMNRKAALACVALLASAAGMPDAHAQQGVWWKKFSGKAQQQPTAEGAQQADAGAQRPEATQATAPIPAPAATSAASQPATTLQGPAPLPEGPGYTYVEAGYNQVAVDVGPGDERAGGGYVRGSVAVSDGIHLFGSYGRVSKDWSDDVGRLDLDIDQVEIGVGSHYRFAERADFVTELSLLRLGASVDYRDIDPSYNLSGNDHLYAGKLTLGVRAKPSRRTELWIKGGYVRLEDNLLLDDSFVGIVGGRIDFTRTWGLLGEAELYEDVSYYRIGLRAGF